MAKRPKYGNKKVTVDGIKFDSIKEARRYNFLKTLQRDGSIHSLKLQPVFKFPINGENIRYVDSKREMKYIADFEYFTSEGLRVIEDAKGFKTEKYKIKKALMLAVHGLLIQET